jgi:N-dimethylarginine dimethylaminohydrolase
MRDTILMCHPSEFNVSYVINPWMKDHVANSDHGLAMEQWNILSQKVASVSNLNVMWQAAGLPDMVFTANAGLVIGSHFVPSRFKHHERSGEEQFFIDWFKQEGFNIVEVPDGIAFEGAGDALFDRQQMILWLGYGHRSDFEVAEFLWNELTLKTVSLNLIDDRFYHLDTCFCPLDDGYLMYYPGAFDLKSNELIESNVPFEKRIIVSEEDALNFACNAINTNYHIILNKASKDLRIKLESLFFVVQESSLTEFIKAGGSAKCLTIRLNEQHMLLDALCF